MTTDIEIEMEALEVKAREILYDQDLSPLQRRRMLKRLLAEYRHLERYNRALAEYIRRMLAVAPEVLDAEQVMQELMESGEFGALHAGLLAALIAATYENGPRANWVPFSFVPAPMPIPGFGF